MTRTTLNASCRRERRGAFTLIELLIVVAIIAILAAIAVPNFLEAQTRAKVSRVKADIRTVALGIECYGVDNNAYPPHLLPGNVEVAYPDRFVPLTTPIAYLTSLPPRDPFYRYTAADPTEWITWTNFQNFPDTHALAPAKDTHRWLLRSRGPDTVLESNAVRNAYMTGGIAAGPSMMYDPTNGTVTPGDVFRTAKGMPQ